MSKFDGGTSGRCAELSFMASSSAPEHPSGVVAKAQSLSVGIEDLSASSAFPNVNSDVRLESHAAPFPLQNLRLDIPAFLLCNSQSQGLGERSPLSLPLSFPFALGQGDL